MPNMITYKELTEKHGSLLNVAIFLKFVTEKSTIKRKRNAVARVANWSKIGIPVRILKRLK